MLKILIFLLVCELSDSELRAVYQELQSPYCPGRALSDCPTEKAENLREEIKLRLESGEDKNNLIEEIILKYGEEYRAKPKISGFGIVAWIMPIIFIVGLGTFFILRLKPKAQEHTEDR